MKLEQQVVSLELAQKLKELGIKQNAYWYWCVFNDGSKRLQQMMTEDLGNTHGNSCSAFSVAELGEMLPINVCYRWTSTSNGHVLHFGEKRFIADTEADARAKMLVYLLENKLIAPHTEE